MSYELAFRQQALKEWRKLGATIREQFKTKLAERLERPHVSASRLRGSINRYKIKLRDAGYRLVYEVEDDRLLVVVVAVGRRSQVYEKARRR